jgi:hypothetical protein
MTSNLSLDLMPPFKRRDEQDSRRDPPPDKETGRPTGRNSCEPEIRRRSDHEHDPRFLISSQGGLLSLSICSNWACQSQRLIDQNWSFQRRSA